MFLFFFSPLFTKWNGRFQSVGQTARVTFPLFTTLRNRIHLFSAVLLSWCTLYTRHFMSSRSHGSADGKNKIFGGASVQWKWWGEAPLSDLLFSLICIIITYQHYFLRVKVTNVKCSHIAKNSTNKLVSILILRDSCHKYHCLYILSQFCISLLPPKCANHSTSPFGSFYST